MPIKLEILTKKFRPIIERYVIQKTFGGEAFVSFKHFARQAFDLILVLNANAFFDSIT
jgi:hypothetical protein